MKRWVQITSVPLALAILLLSLGPSLALERQTRLDVMAGVVQVSLVKIKGGQVYYLPWGSGTIISPEGLVLTNCHVADPSRFGFPPDQVPDYDCLGIGLTVSSDQPPQLAYLGQAIQADPNLDLAVIQITHKIDGTAVKPGSLKLPYVEIGDSDAIEVGDELNIFGYPGIGGETVTFTRGVVSGFTLDAAITGRAWIKTDASISGGNSGGTAVDGDGLLVGVPTRAGAGGGTDPVDCRPVKDTNGDGRVDSNDDCVPLGGFINALRPVALARPLIERAQLGLPDPGQGQQPGDKEQPSGQARFSNLFFAPGVNEFNQPTSVVTSLPSGARSLYLFFDYEGMSSAMTLEMKVYIDGKEYPDWGLPASPWGGNENGVWWIGWSDADLVDGSYRLVLYVDGTRMAEAEIEIGGRAKADPTFSNILLGLEASSSGVPTDPAVVFPAGIKTLYASFDFENMSSGLEWTRTWLIDGSVGLTKDEAWDAGRSGTYTLELTSKRGLQAGAYRLNLYIEGELAAVSNFWVTGGEGEASFGPITFAEGIDRNGKPVGAARSFSSGLDELHAFSEYEGMEDGLNFAVKWYLNGENVVHDPVAWDGGETGSWHYYLYSSSGPLPDGEYDLELLVEGQVIQSASTTVGTGAAPTPTPGSEDGVRLEGTITDLDTGRPIPGAVFLVLEPGVTLDTFQWTSAEVYTSAEADRRGYYKLPLALERGQCYTMIVGAEGYWPFGQDDVCVKRDADAVQIVDIRLDRK